MAGYNGAAEVSSGAAFPDDEVLKFGTSDDAAILWSTDDANANALFVELPTGGSINVPVAVFGIGIDGVDLGLFNGFTQPTVAAVDADRDSYVALHSFADDEPGVRFFGAGASTTWHVAINNVADRLIIGAGATVGSNRVMDFSPITSGTTATSRVGIRNDLGFTASDGSTAGFRILTMNGVTTTLAGTTQVTTEWDYVVVNQQTINQSGGAVTVDSVNALNLTAAVAGTSVTITNNSGLRVKTGGASATLHGIIIETQTAGTSANYLITLGSTDADHNLLHVGVTGDPIMSWDESEDSFAWNKDLIPSTDGGADLGTQTTFQWANVWADLVNGADIMMANRWRMLESELYQGYPSGWAIGHNEEWVDGQSLWKAITEDGLDVLSNDRPVFAVTDSWLEYRGRRITPEQLDRILELVEA